MTDKNNRTLELNDEEKAKLTKLAGELTSFRDAEEWLQVSLSFGLHKLNELSLNMLWAFDHQIEDDDARIGQGEKWQKTMEAVFEVLNIENEKPTWIKNETLKGIKTKAEKLKASVECIMQDKKRLQDMRQQLETLNASRVKSLEIMNGYVRDIYLLIMELCK